MICLKKSQSHFKIFFIFFENDIIFFKAGCFLFILKSQSEHLGQRLDTRSLIFVKVVKINVVERIMDERLSFKAFQSFVSKIINSTRIFARLILSRV